MSHVSFIFILGNQLQSNYLEYHKLHLSNLTYLDFYRMFHYLQHHIPNFVYIDLQIYQ